MRGLLLTSDDFTKTVSTEWPRRCLAQWIESVYGHDDDIADRAYEIAFKFIERRGQPLPVCDDSEYSDERDYSLSTWSARHDVTYEDLASCWNSVVAQVDMEYGYRMILPRSEEAVL